MKQYGFETENSDESDKEQLPELAKGDVLLFEKLEPEQNLPHHHHVTQKQA